MGGDSVADDDSSTEASSGAGVCGSTSPEQATKNKVSSAMMFFML
jgi:hypothetical protein